MPGVETVAVGLYAEVGSRSEAARQGRARPSRRAYGVQGRAAAATRARSPRRSRMSAATSTPGPTRDQTAFHARMLAPRSGAGARAHRRSGPRAHMLERGSSNAKKVVILSELGEASTSPDDLIHDHLFDAAFGDQPLGRPVLGREASIAASPATIASPGWPSSIARAAGPVGRGKVDPGAYPEARRSAVRRPERPRRAAAEPRPRSPAGYATTGVRRADPSRLRLPGLPGADPRRPRRAAIRPGGRRRHVVAPVPGTARGARPGLFHLRLDAGLRRYGLFAVNLAAQRQGTRGGGDDAGARVLAETAAEDLSEAEVNRARRCQGGAVMSLMALETPQGRADQMARSIEIHGRIDRRRDARRASRGGRWRPAQAAGAAMLDGPRAIASIGGKLAAARHDAVSDDRRRALGRLGADRQRRWPEVGTLRPVTVVRPEPQAMWAPALGRLGPRRDLRPRLGRGRRRTLGPASPGPARAGSCRGTRSASTPA